jgi:hypothetical protein
MHLSKLGILISVGALLVVASLVWLLVVIFRREQYTRERFAFAALAALTTLGATVLGSLAHNESIWEIIADLVRDFRGIQASPEPARLPDHILMLVAFTAILVFIVRIYEGWDGAISERQYQKQRYHEPTPLIKEGLHEAKRVLKREPPPVLHTPVEHSFQSALEGPQDNLAWHIHARDLICLRSPSFEIDRDIGWHHEARCWIGLNKRTRDVVAVRCDAGELSAGSVEEFIKYVVRVSPPPPSGFEFILAVRDSVDTGLKTFGGRQVLKESEGTLLNELVDFGDYYADISYRAERQHLPDSIQTLSQVYARPSCIDEGGSRHADIESYLQAWLVEPGQRQIALLGEYGQGKSTTALMFAHRMIAERDPQRRIPVLIELRGKSPRNMTVEQIIAGWAYPYRIDPMAVMKLLIAGKIFLILEGFDEMALIGDSEARLSHFRTLWGFCYPDAKILITGRPNFFLDDDEMRAALGISRSAATGPYCEALRLEPLSLPQIELALRATPGPARDEILQLASSDTKFREIVARGSLLYLVSQLWEREHLSEFKGRINSAFVMGLFIQHSYRRQTLKSAQAGEFMVLNENERKYFMDGIAAYMCALGLPNQISRNDFEKAVRALYAVIPDSVSSGSVGLPTAPQKPLRLRLMGDEDAVMNVGNDVRSSGILVVDPSKSGALKFAHKSFMEFLVASVYADKLLGRNRESNSALLLTSRLTAEDLSPESLKFLAETLVTGLAAHEDEPPSPGPMSRRLFDLIVVSSAGGGWRGRILARAALVESRYVALIHRESRRGRRLSRVIPLLYPQRLAFFLLMLLLGFLVFKGELAYMDGTRHGLFRFPLSATAVACALWAMMSMSIMRKRALLRSGTLVFIPGGSFGDRAIRLWFNCCVLANLSGEDISEVVGRGMLEPFSDHFLSVPDYYR